MLNHESCIMCLEEFAYEDDSEETSELYACHPGVFTKIGTRMICSQCIDVMINQIIEDMKNKNLKLSSYEPPTKAIA